MAKKAKAVKIAKGKKPEKNLLNPASEIKLPMEKAAKTEKKGIKIGGKAKHKGDTFKM